MSRRSIAAGAISIGMLAFAGLAAPVGAGAAPTATGMVPGPAATRVSACRAAHMRATFSVIRGSAGAGNIVYRLRLRNEGTSACEVSGLPRLRLVGLHGRLLPTHAVPARPGAGTAALVRLRHGDSAWLTARFSPDVPGTGEPTNGPCEPVAYSIEVSAALMSGATVGPISPPTSVCEHGGMSLTTFSSREPAY